MGNLALDNQLLASINALAKQFKTTKQDIVKKAVDNYKEKVAHKNRLMDFAGTLDNKEADDLLTTIYENRRNKEAAPRL